MSERRQLYTYIASGLIVLIGAYLIMLPIFRDSAATSYEQIGTLLGNLDLTKQQATQSESFQLKFQSVLKSDSQLDDYYFTRGDELKFFQLLEKAATEAGIEQNVEFMPGESTDRIGPIPATIRIAASFERLIAFMDELEHLPQPITIDNIALQAGDPTAITLKVTTHWYTPNAD
jgi:Tfp pilus assembly protein PilO